MLEKCELLVQAWHEAGRKYFEKHYSNLDYDSPYYLKTAKEKKKYINLDRGTGGYYMVDKGTGLVYRIKAYGVPNKKKCLGHIDGVTGEMLNIRR